MRASVLTPFVDIVPGEPVDIRIEVVNTLEIVDLITVDVPGLAPAEVRFDRESVSLFPDETATMTVTLLLRRTYPAGPGVLQLRIASALRPEMVELREIGIDVAPVEQAEMAVTPQAIVGKSRVSLVAQVVNTGNTTLNMAMLVRDDQRHLRWEVSPPSLRIHPEAAADVVIRGKGRRPFFGTPAYRTIYVSADSEAGLLEDTVTLTQRPVFVRGLLTALVLAAILALWALIVTVGVDFVLGNDPAPKAVPADFASPLSYATLASVGSAGAVGGSQSAAVQAVLGSVSGSVVGADNGKPIPRIAVEAHRRTRKDPTAVLGTDQTLVQSAATDEEGTFLLEGIFPGDYFLKLVGPGFEDAWYPGVATAGDAGRVELDAGEDLELDAVQVSGLPGTITGEVDTGDQIVPVTVVVRPLVDDVPGFEVARVEIQATDADGDGFADQPARYEIGGLASPLDYSITFNSDEFADQVISEELGAGDRLEATPVRLLPGDGSIVGTIVLLGIPPDQGVVVTAAAGETTFTVETPPPTTDPADGGRSTVGFAFTGLPTPSTYELHFEVAGYEPTFTSVDLLAGATGQVDEVVLNGGSRMFTGTVIDADTGLRLGDADVVVLGADQEIATQTLPAPTTVPGGARPDCRTPDPVAAYDDASGAGTFLFDDLPLGVLSVSVSRPGYATSTQRIEVTGTGPPLALTPDIADRVIELTNVVGEICGTVRRSDAPGEPGVSSGEVLLRGGAPGEDGKSPERMPTPLSTEPPGTYKITDLLADEYTLTASAPGYRDCTLVFEVGVGARARRARVLDLLLVPSASPDTEQCTVRESGS